MLTPNINEFQATLIASIPLFLCGVDASFPADLKNVIQNKTITVLEESIVGSINIYGRAAGAFTCGYIVNKIGRKNSIIVSLILSTTAWTVITYFSYNIEILYVGRILSGIACGMRAATILYVSEIAHKNQRGRLITICQLSNSVGVTCTYLIQYFCSSKMVAVFALIISVFGLTQAFFMYETKYWLLMKNRPEEAQISMLWFDDTMTVTEALKEIEEIQTQQEQSTGGRKCFAVCERWSNFKHLIICTLIFSCRAASGRIPILVHPRIYYKLFLLPVSVDIATLFQGILEFFFSFLNLFIADSFPRKIMLQSVCWIMCSCLTVSYFQVSLVGTLGIFGEYFNWMCSMVYIGLACGSLMSLTLITVTEIASTATEVRGIILTICQLSNNLTSGIFTSFFPFVLASVPLHYILSFMFANLIMISLLVTLVPETVGKMLHQCNWEEEKAELLSETENQHETEDDSEKLLGKDDTLEVIVGAR